MSTWEYSQEDEMRGKGNERIATDVGESNASLIATAPELLAKLKQLRAMLADMDHDCGTPMGDACQDCADMQEIDDLIDKAEGDVK